MRIKITFNKQFKSPSNLPLHHQNTLYRCLSEFIETPQDPKTLFTFSPIKGTSTVFKGYVKFISNKVNLIVSSNDAEFLERMVDKMFQRRIIYIGKMNLLPKLKTVIEMPEFKTEMKYLCISPIVLIDCEKGQEESERNIDPTSQEFSDILFNTTIERMHAAGFTEDELHEFDTFEVVADKSYIQKITENNKRFARFYKNLEGKTMVGYLLPFTLHAHPKVHEFIFNAGLGLYTSQGYGMIDVVQENTPQSSSNLTDESYTPGSDPNFDAIFN
ncbi:MAG: CRISPR-associated endoribonuclease Cas6 [Bacteroidota bacterium]